MRLGDYEATIVSGNHQLPEYQTEIDPQGRIATCWIPSNERHAFAIRCSLGDGTDSVRLTLLADGQILDTRIADRVERASLSGIRMSSTEVRPFLFSSGWVPTEDYDEDELDDRNPQRWKKRGLITLEMTHIRVQFYEHLADDQPSSIIPQSSFETVNLGTGLRDTRKLMPRRTVGWNFTEEGDVPFATFNFKHRPQPWLESYGIMPRSNLLDLSSMSLNPAPEYIQQLSDMRLDEQAQSQMQM